jgi:hypothetical protein
LVAFTTNASSDNKIIALKTMQIIKIQPMREFLNSKKIHAEFENEVYLVTLEDGTLTVFKPEPIDDLGYAHAEVAAYKASQFLGFPRVPPTVLRKIGSKIGSLQLYIEPNIDISNTRVYRKILRKAPKDEIANLKLFYFIFGQWDSGPNNMIIRKDAGKIKIYAIDNSGISNHQHVSYGSLPFIKFCHSYKFETNDQNSPFPFHASKVIGRPNIKNITAAFGNALNEKPLKYLAKRKSPIKYVIYQNSLWMQHYWSDPNFIRSHTNYYPEKTMEIIKKLTLQDLQNIYSEAKGSDFLTMEYFKAILERRDQVVLAYDKSKIEKLKIL